MTWGLLGVNVTFDNTRDAMTWLVILLALLTPVARGLYLLYQFARRLERVMVNVESQLYPNGGSTLRDAVTSIQHKLEIEPHMPANDPNHAKGETHDS
jgi:hypothetical protein